MPFLLARDALTLAEAAQHLGVTEKKVELAIIGGDLPCGVIARGWRGIALPDLIPGVEWKGGITSLVPREYAYTAYDADGNELYKAKVPEVEVAYFWYLDPVEAYDLLVMPKFGAGRVINFLHPHEGDEMHASVPHRWPAPPFTVWLNSEQEHDLLITRADLLLLRADINRFMAAGGEPLPNAAAPRNHDDLTIGALALELVERGGKAYGSPQDPNVSALVRAINAALGHEGYGAGAKGSVPCAPGQSVSALSVRLREAIEAARSYLAAPRR